MKHAHCMQADVLAVALLAAGWVLQADTNSSSLVTIPLRRAFHMPIAVGLVSVARGCAQQLMLQPVVPRLCSSS